MSRFKQHITSKRGGVNLSATVFLPVEGVSGDTLDSAPRQALCFVFMHPYSLLGGSQMNTIGLAKKIWHSGVAAISFDARGSGDSGGWGTIFQGSEVEDTVAVCEWAAAFVSENLVVCGSSAGACVAGSSLPRLGGEIASSSGSVDKDMRILAYIGIGYTFGFWASLLFGSHFKHVLGWEGRKLFIMGDHDEFTTVQKLHDVLETRSQGDTSMHIVEGVGHFELESPAFDGMIAQLCLKFVVDTCLSSGTTHSAASHLVSEQLRRELDAARLPAFTPVTKPSELGGGRRAGRTGCL
mmetsp:Transcript_9356/g.34318  ORF Transcript_9356/g.34318 Transcript_9356/m.34318 type:complete len:296 (+) Transcript_9356:112-999(+)